MLTSSTLLAQAPQLEDVVGMIDTPPGIDKQITAAGIGPGDNALLFFISNLLRIATILVGVWVLFNVLLAGYDFISSQGKSDAYQKVRDKLTMSVIGLLLITVAYTIGGLIGLILFGDAGYLLNPQF
ncbi:MAG: hypothetical protein ABIJ03_04445 [Patescibacteria group bacterium]